MDPARLFEELLRVAERLGLQVRIQPFATPPVQAGGMCWVRGRQLILLDANAPVVERTATLAEALCTVDLEDLYVAPEARLAVEAARQRLQARPAPPPRGPGPGENVTELVRAKPGLRFTGRTREPQEES
jgi:hypothetical protein